VLDLESADGGPASGVGGAPDIIVDASGLGRGRGGPRGSVQPATKSKTPSAVHLHVANDDEIENVICSHHDSMASNTRGCSILDGN
jgi:hypothetical protein